MIFGASYSGTCLAVMLVLRPSRLLRLGLFAAHSVSVCVCADDQFILVSTQSYKAIT